VAPDGRGVNLMSRDWTSLRASWRNETMSQNFGATARLQTGRSTDADEQHFLEGHKIAVQLSGAFYRTFPESADR